MPTVDLGLVVGSNGQGVPTGGSAGQILAKNSSSNYDTDWVPMSAAAAAAFGIVETGNAASQTIAAGQYVIWKGVLYTADAAIASGTTLAASGGNKNLTAVPNGGLNALNSNLAFSGRIDLKNENLTGVTGRVERAKWGRVVVVRADLGISTTLPSGTVVATSDIPVNFNGSGTKFSGIMHNVVNSEIVPVEIDNTNGQIVLKQAINVAGGTKYFGMELIYISAS